MNNLNSILIEGNVVRESQHKTTPKGTLVCNFTIASCRYYKVQEGIEKEVSFFDIETWAKLGEKCINHGRKGRGVRVVGRLKQKRWKDDGGEDHAQIVVVAEHVEFRPEFKPNKKNPDGTTIYTEEEIESMAINESADEAV